MKKITFFIACLIATLSYSQTYTETFDSEVLAPVLQDASNEGLDNSYFSTIASGDGIWYTVQGFGTTDFGIQTSNGNPGNYVSRISETQFARGFAYVYNNADASVTGSIDISFDYFYNTSFDNGNTNGRFGFRVWGISTDSSVDGVFALTSGNGNFGDNNSTNYTLSSGEETSLLAHTHVPYSNSWTNSGNFTIDFGTAGQYDIIVVVFGQVFGNPDQTGNPVETYFGVDNVVLPTQSNPQPTVLSTEGFDRPQLSVYPNPVNDIINIKNLKGEYSYNIYNFTGKLLLNNTKAISKEINVSSLSKGLYLLEVIDSENVKSISKIIKE